MPEPRRSRPPTFQPRFTLSLLYLFGFFLRSSIDLSFSYLFRIFFRCRFDLSSITLGLVFGFGLDLALSCFFGVRSGY